MRSKNLIFKHLIFMAGFVFLLACPALTQVIQYPDHQDIINITEPPYNADNTGSNDVSDIIQQAIDDNSPGGWKIIYFPKGTYLVSKTISWNPNSWSQGPVFQGYHTDSTIIKLEDNAPLFGEPAIPKAVLHTGEGVAQKFDRGIRNMTINTGIGNPGAVGIEFFSNNEGIMSDIKVISGDGSGRIGIDMGFGGENGPLLIRNLYVKGFDIGLNVKALNSVTLSNVTLEDQNELAIKNYQHVCTIENLHSINNVPVIDNGLGGSTFTMINSTLEGGSPDTFAITNRGIMYLRNIHATGYKACLNNLSGDSISPEGNDIAEFSSTGVTSLFPNEGHSLDLEIKEPPVIPWENDTSQWVNIQDYGAIPNDHIDDSPAMQAAIDAGKTTVYIPNNGKYNLDDTVYIRGKVNRITGINAWLWGSGTMILTDEGDAPAVIVQNIRRDNPNQTFSIENKSSRTLVMEADIFHFIISSGSGDIFLSDVLGKIEINTPDEHVWARHLNTENPRETDYNILNDSGFLWILGLKTESYGIKSWVQNGGRTEILGAHIYPQCTFKLTPMMEIDDAYYSGACIRETNYCNKDYPSYYTQYVVETQGEVSDTLYHDDAPVKGSGSGRAYGLYVSSTEGLSLPAWITDLSYTATGTNTIELTWTKDAVNTTGYILQRTDSGLFRDIDTINSSVNSFTDTGLDPDTYYYYRIKSYNDDEFTSISNTVTVNINNPVSVQPNRTGHLSSFTIYPNPGREQFTLRLKEPASGDLTLRVFNQMGKVILSRQYASSGPISFGLAECPPGIYMVSLEYGNKIAYEKIMKY